LEERLQIAERIGPTRQMQAGHDRPVFVYNIVARDTVDELVLERVESKREVQDILMDAMKRRQ
jgi:SNF2 family DNA or RNA helicase